MRIYRGSDADIVLRPFMVRLSEIVSFDLQLWTSGAYVIKRSTTESGMTTDKENNLINVHLTDKETSYLDAGVLNAKMMYRITDSEYPDGTYDGIITIPQEYYMMTPPDYSGSTAGDIYESGYTEGYNTAIQNSVLSINGEKGDLNLKTINGNGLLGEGDIKIEGGGSGSTSDFSYFYIDAADFTLPAIDGHIKIPIEKIRYYGAEPYYYGCITIKEISGNMVTIPINFGSSGNTSAYFIYERYTYNIDISEERGITIMTGIPIDTTVPICYLIGYVGDEFLSIDDLPTTVGDSTFKLDGSLIFSGDINHYEIAKMKFRGNGAGPYNFYYVDGNIYGQVTKNGTDPITVRFGCEKGYYEANYDREGNTVTFTCLQVWGGGVTSVNGQKGDVVIDIPKKTSQLQNDSKYINQSSQSSTYNIEHMWVGNQSQYDALETKDARTLFIII